IEERPRLGLRSAPIREVELGIVASRDPCFAALTLVHREAASGVCFGPFLRARLEPPEPLPGVDVDPADVAPVGLTRAAPGHPLQHLVADDDRAARAGVP